MLHPGPPLDARCPYCGAPRDALQAMRGSTCGRPACRHAADIGKQVVERRAELDRRRSAAVRAGAPAALAQAPVIWLAPHPVRITELPRALRDAQVRHLHALAAGADGPPLPPNAWPGAGAADQAPAAGAVCALCRGRCCRPGREHHGFVDRALLQRWAARHAAASLQDAAEAYRRRLPRRHVAGSCAYHGAHGCTLPREMRSDICNDFGCEGLRDARSLDTEAGWVVALPQAATVDRAAWVQGGRVQPLPRRPKAAR